MRRNFIRKKRGGFNWIIFLVIILALVIILTSFFVLRSDFFKIKSVDVESDKLTCTDSEKIKSLSNLLGQNLLFVNLTKTKEVIVGKFFCIRDLKISKGFPDKAKLIVSGRKAKAIFLVLKPQGATESATIFNIATPSAKELKDAEKFEVDTDGVVFAKGDQRFDLPKIYYYGENLTLGKRISEALIGAIKILNNLRNIGLEYKDGKIKDGIFLVAFSTDKPIVVFKLGQDVNDQLASLQLILRQAKIEEKEVEFIDLRFDKPVARFAPEKS